MFALSPKLLLPNRILTSVDAFGGQRGGKAMETTATRPSQPTSLMSTARAVVLLGRRCEVAIHDFSDRSAQDHPVVAMEGNLTGRRSGRPPTVSIRCAYFGPAQGGEVGTWRWSKLWPLPLPEIWATATSNVNSNLASTLLVLNGPYGSLKVHSSLTGRGGPNDSMGMGTRPTSTSTCQPVTISRAPSWRCPSRVDTH